MSRVSYNRMQLNTTTLIETDLTGVIINLGKTQRIPPGEGREFQIGDEEIVIFRTRKDKIFGLQAKCPHREGALADGLTGDGKVICPMHAFKFELATGHPIGNDCESLKTYQVEVSDSGEILLHWSSNVSTRSGSVRVN